MADLACIGAAEQQPRALIVEDDRPLGFLWDETLSDAGFACDVCTTLEQAEARSLSSRYDLVILDLFLHSRSTLSLSDVIAIRHPETPILLVTGTSVFREGDHAEVAPGISWVLHKPVRPDDLCAMAGYLARCKGCPKLGDCPTSTGPGRVH
ncbi:response regulator [Rhodovulum sp. DZ06]|uniref:response regulator n=1 Tax=Rhodovulum sp. DZ06 TaxID=3425126 RepID=UPI003D34EECC